MKDFMGTRSSRHSRTHVNSQRSWQHVQELHWSKSDRVPGLRGEVDMSIHDDNLQGKKIISSIFTSLSIQPLLKGRLCAQQMTNIKQTRSYFGEFLSHNAIAGLLVTCLCLYIMISNYVFLFDFYVGRCMTLCLFLSLVHFLCLVYTLVFFFPILLLFLF